MNPNTEKQLTETLSQLDKDQLIELLINLIDNNMKSANAVLNTEKELLSKTLPSITNNTMCTLPHKTTSAT